MKRANRLMLVAGIILAAIAFVAVLAFASLNQQPPPAIPAVSVVVAAADLPLGTSLSAEVLTTETRPQADASGTYQSVDELIGHIVRRTVARGQALTAADFDTTSGFAVASALRPGLRGIAVPLSRVDAVGALLQPGDYVDVILSLEELDSLNPMVVPNPNAGQTSIDGTVVEPYISIDSYLNNTTVKVVVQNVQVLATLPRSTEPSNIVASAGIPEPDLIVVLAVSPQQAEVIRFAQLDAHVSLALRAPADYTAAETSTSGITLKQLVELYGVLPPAPVTP